MKRPITELPEYLKDANKRLSNSNKLMKIFKTVFPILVFGEMILSRTSLRHSRFFSSLFMFILFFVFVPTFIIMSIKMKNKSQYKYGLLKQIDVTDCQFDTTELYYENEELVPIDNYDIVALLIFSVISVENFLNIQIYQLVENGNIVYKNGRYQIQNQETTDEIQGIILDQIKLLQGQIIDAKGVYIKKLTKYTNALLIAKIRRLLTNADMIRPVYNKGHITYYSATEYAENQTIKIIHYMNYLYRRNTLFDVFPFSAM